MVIFLVALFYLFSISITQAFLIQPFGGKVQQAPSAEAVCPGIVGGPIVIRPVIKSIPSMPYDVSLSTSRGQVRTGSWILGLYSTAMSPLCVTPEETPYNVYPIQKYGTSRLF